MGVGYFYDGLNSGFKQLVSTLPAFDLFGCHTLLAQDLLGHVVGGINEEKENEQQ